jgi:hypothetical protein
VPAQPQELRAIRCAAGLAEPASVESRAKHGARLL